VALLEWESDHNFVPREIQFQLKKLHHVFKKFPTKGERILSLHAMTSG
jgi:hypothetical protein